jgi:hypothetical protein
MHGKGRQQSYWLSRGQCINVTMLLLLIMMMNFIIEITLDATRRQDKHGITTLGVQINEGKATAT